MAKLKGAANWADYWATYGTGVVLVAVTFVIAYQYVNPAPQKKIIMATGAVDGAYHRSRGSRCPAVTLPRGTFDLVNELPQHDTHLLAATAMLVARGSLHLALIDLVLEAAGDVHSQGGVFEKEGAFPSPHHLNLPLSSEAGRFYKFGPPLLRRYLPFWAATMVDRLKVMLLPLIAVLFPLLRATPPLYRWRVRRRIYRWYEELDPEFGEQDRRLGTLERSLVELDRLEREVQHVSVPLPYADHQYDLRLHIGLVRGKLVALRDGAAV